MNSLRFDGTGGGGEGQASARQPPARIHPGGVPAPSARKFTLTDSTGVLGTSSVDGYARGVASRIRAALYHRVSTVDQNPHLARHELRAAARRLGLRVALDMRETGSRANHQ